MTKLLTTLFTLIIGLCQLYAQPFGTDIQHGDLLFNVSKPRGGFGGAIIDATFGIDNMNISHVAIAMKQGNKINVIEATGKYGVRICPVDSFLAHADHDTEGNPMVLIGRLNDRSIVKQSVRRAEKYLGKPYDYIFSDTEEAIYCSELVHFAFLDAKGNYIFPQEPMSFHDKHGKILPYWTKYYADKGLKVPEGEPGTNPGGISRSKAITIVHRMFKDMGTEVAKINPRQRDASWKMIWNDEFDGSGSYDNKKWQAEKGFVRNEEDQWYQEDNAYLQNGLLILEGRIDSIPNPRYNSQRTDWRSSRKYARYSSASLNTRSSFSFKYGQMEVRARIPAVNGSWPAIWTLGTDMEWPSNGECDIMEFYHIDGKPHILANAAWGNDRRYGAVWNSKKIPYNHFLKKDAGWGEKFHVWLMDWTEDYIRIFLDGELLNDIDLSTTINGTIGNHTNPFHAPQYILLNLAIGGINGGTIQPDAFPMRYEIDYVRVWQKR